MSLYMSYLEAKLSNDFTYESITLIESLRVHFFNGQLFLFIVDFIPFEVGVAREAYVPISKQSFLSTVYGLPTYRFFR